MRVFVSVTDNSWFDFLKDSDHTEINFWRPGGKSNFKALTNGELMLFKLHGQRDYIVGGGFFLSYSIIPASVAWSAYGTANGTQTREEFYSKIHKYRRTNHSEDPNPEIGCIMLSEPFYFPESKWIKMSNWSKSIVQGKTYDTSEDEGKMLFEMVKDRFINSINLKNYLEEDIEETVTQRFGKEQIIKSRIGQSAFRVMVLDAYNRRCAITGEKTIPVLQAAHIKPFSQSGPHDIGNGMLLRSDFHTLFDNGYITVDTDFRINVSQRIKEEFGNGKEYYAYNGKGPAVMPADINLYPQRDFLQWHNENIYVG